MGAQVIHFLLHVPKCAGTTVEEHFARHLGPVFRIAPRWDHPLRNLIGNRYPGLDPIGLRVVSGHSLSAGMARLFPGSDIRESVLLRDPLGYLLSFYNYRWTRFGAGFGAEPPPFATWYAAQRRNPISRFLINRYFEQGVPALYRLSSAARLRFLEGRLRRFHFVGSYRRAGELIADVSRDLGIPEAAEARNVTPEKRVRADDLPDRLLRRISVDNTLDEALFARWKDRGFQGGPDAPPPPLPEWDHLRYALGDSTTGVAKKLIR